MKIEHTNSGSTDPSSILIVGGESHMVLHFQKPGMTISLNRDEAAELDKAILFSVEKILSYSRYAMNYGKMLRKAITALKYRFEKLGFIDDKGMMRELTDVELESYADDAFKEWVTDWLYGMSGWGKDTREFIEKAIGDEKLVMKDDSWLVDNSSFELIPDGTKIDSMFKITNADSLVGMVKPEYMHNGNIDLAISDWSLKISIKGEDAKMLMMYFAGSKKIELAAAELLWDRLKLIQTAYKRFKDSFKENGLDSDTYYIDNDEVDPARLSTEFNALFSALESPETMQSFADEFADKEKPTDNSVSISFS